MEEKKEIRKKIFKVRKEHTNAWIRENSLRITEALTQLPEYRNAERIMAYADYNHEVITRYIIEQAWKDGKEVAVPKVFGKDMVFYRLTDFSQLESGYFGIPEPKAAFLCSRYSSSSFRFSSGKKFMESSTFLFSWTARIA